MQSFPRCVRSTHWPSWPRAPGIGCTCTEAAPMTPTFRLRRTPAPLPAGSTSLHASAAVSFSSVPRSYPRFYARPSCSGDWGSPRPQFCSSISTSIRRPIDCFLRQSATPASRLRRPRPRSLALLACSTPLPSRGMSFTPRPPGPGSALKPTQPRVSRWSCLSWQVASLCWDVC